MNDLTGPENNAPVKFRDSESPNNLNMIRGINESRTSTNLFASVPSNQSCTTPSIFKKCEEKKEHLLKIINKNIGKMPIQLGNINHVIKTNLLPTETKSKYENPKEAILVNGNILPNRVLVNSPKIPSDLASYNIKKNNENFDKIIENNKSIKGSPLPRSHNESKIKTEMENIKNNISVKRGDLKKFKTNTDLLNSEGMVNGHSILKSYLPKKLKFKFSNDQRLSNPSKFDVKITENTNKIVFEKEQENSVGKSKEKKQFEVKSEIQLKLSIHRDDIRSSKNGKSHHEIIFDYNFRTDTIEEVFEELRLVHKLSEEEGRSVLKKLKEFRKIIFNLVSSYNNTNDQKYSLEAGGSTAADVDIISQQKKSFENFFESYDLIMKKMNKLLKNEDKITEAVN